MTIMETQLLAQRLEATEAAAGFQAKFGHMSQDILLTECIETSAISGQILPIQP